MITNGGINTEQTVFTPESRKTVKLVRGYSNPLGTKNTAENQSLP